MAKGYALLMEMGCGKTITTVAITGRAYLNNKIKRLLIIAPKSIVNVWEDEFSKFADFQYSLSILTGSSTNKIKVLKCISCQGLEIAVVNYDSVGLIEKELLAWNPDFIVCDESTRIKNPAAKVSKSIYNIAKKTKYRLILTGSPITQNAFDVYSQYRVLDDSIFGTSFYAFKNYYAVLGQYNEPVAWKNLPELIKKVHAVAFRVTKADSLDLPETIDEIRPVVLEEKVQKLYKQFVKDSYIELSNNKEVSATNILTRILRLQQITGGHIKPNETDKYEIVSTAKLDALEDIVDECKLNNQKLVVMCRFTPEIEDIARLLEKNKIKYSLVNGSVKDRATEVEKFQNDLDVTVFVGQTQCVSMGLTLTASSTMVFYSTSYNYADYIQAKARIHRIGQKNKCLYIHLVVKGTVDETVLEALQKKENIATSVVDRWKEIIKP